MSLDDDDAAADRYNDDDSAGFRPPPHPDDRLWRHPSELKYETRSTGASESSSQQRWWMRGVLATAACVGLLAGGVLLAAELRNRPSGSPSNESADHGPAADSNSDREAITGRPDEAIEAVAPSVVWITGEDGRLGSGVVADEDGIVYTSADVIGNLEEVDVLVGASTLESDVVGVDGLTGLAVLELPGHNFPAPLHHEPTTAPAENAVVLAYNRSGDLETASGDLAASPTDMDGTEPGSLEAVFHVDAAVPAYALGGPVVDPSGALLGFVAAVDEHDNTADDDNAGAYMVPIDVTNKVAGDLLTTGVTQHAWMGIDGYDYQNDNGSPAGIRVGTATPGGPAEGELQVGDVIVALDEQPVQSMPELALHLRRLSPGEPLQVQYWREDPSDLQTITLRLTPRPLDP